MSIDSRLKQLERRAGDGAMCTCTYPGAFDVRYYPGENSQEDADADTREPDKCAVCDGERDLTKVVYVKGWRSAEAV